MEIWIINLIPNKVNVKYPQGNMLLPAETNFNNKYRKQMSQKITNELRVLVQTSSTISCRVKRGIKTKTRGSKNQSLGEIPQNESEYYWILSKNELVQGVDCTKFEENQSQIATCIAHIFQIYIRHLKNTQYVFWGPGQVLLTIL